MELRAAKPRIASALALLVGLAMPAGAFELSILHTNDVHARLAPSNRFGTACRPKDIEADACWGGLARLVGAVAAARAGGGHHLVLDGGDWFQGSLYFSRYKGLAMAEAMNRIGYDAMAVGNHEFDDGPAGLASFLAVAKFPVLAANLDAAREPSVAGRIGKDVVRRRGGRRIGIFGTITADTPSISSPGRKIVFEPPLAAARRQVAALSAKGIDIIVMVSHIGLDEDREIARAVDGLDIIVGGHSHTMLSNGTFRGAGPYPIVERAPSGQPVLVVQAGSLGHGLGRLRVTFDEAGRPTAWDGDVMPLDAKVAADAKAAAYVAQLDKGLEAIRAQIVGTLAVDLDTANCRNRECRLGNLVADAMLAASRGAGARIAITNGGGIRAGLTAGEISRGQVMEMLPFGNTLAIFTLRGAELKLALENGVSRPGSGRFPHVAGLRFAWDPGRPVGERVTAIEIVGADGGLRPFEADVDYRIVTNSFMRRGGDDYTVFATHAREVYDFGPNMDQAFIAYLRTAGRLAPRREDRSRAANE